MRTVKASAKGQLTIPKEIFDALGGAREFVFVHDGDRVVMMPSEKAAKAIVDDLEDFHHLGLGSLHELWDNEYDEVWNDA